jgi:hypothetical protein
VRQQSTRLTNPVTTLSQTCGARICAFVKVAHPLKQLAGPVTKRVPARPP